MMGAGNVIRLVVFVSCLCGFLWQVWDQTDKFFSGATTVAVSWRKEDEVRFPTFAFCNKLGFTGKGPVAKDSAVNYEIYMKSASSVDANLTGMAWGYSEFIQPGFESVHIPTLFNGLCKVFKLSSPYAKGHYVNFILKRGHSYHMFLLVDGEEKQLVTQHFFNVPKVVKIDDSADLELRKTLQVFNKETCKDHELSDAIDCVHREVALRINDELECVSFLLAQILPGFENRTCPEPVQETSILRVSKK